MRSFHLLFVLAFCIPFEAGSQTYYCNRPSEPYLVSGYSADYDAMMRAQREVEDYLEQMQDYRECLVNEIEDAGSEAEQVVDEWDRAVRQFNTQ